MSNAKVILAVGVFIFFATVCGIMAKMDLKPGVVRISRVMICMVTVVFGAVCIGTILKI